MDPVDGSWRLAAAVVAGCAFCATDGFGQRPGLFDAVRASADLDKTMLGLGRLVHFAGLAALVWALRLVDVVRLTPLYRPLCLLGRHGLAIFAILSLLAAVGQVLTQGLGHSFVLDLLVVGGGLLILFASARLLERQPQTSGPAALSYTGLSGAASSRTTL